MLTQIFNRSQKVFLAVAHEAEGEIAGSAQQAPYHASQMAVIERKPILSNGPAYLATNGAHTALCLVHALVSPVRDSVFVFQDGVNAARGVLIFPSSRTLLANLTSAVELGFGAVKSIAWLCFAAMFATLEVGVKGFWSQSKFSALFGSARQAVRISTISFLPIYGKVAGWLGRLAGIAVFHAIWRGHSRRPCAERSICFHAVSDAFARLAVCGQPARLGSVFVKLANWLGLPALRAALFHVLTPATFHKHTIGLSGI